MVNTYLALFTSRSLCITLRLFFTGLTRLQFKRTTARQLATYENFHGAFYYSKGFDLQKKVMNSDYLDNFEPHSMHNS